MKTNTTAPKYKGFRFPPEIISHAVWLFFRFLLRFCDVEELLAERGIVITSETIRQWYFKFGQMYANELRYRRPRCGDKWHLDEVFLTISVHCLTRIFPYRPANPFSLSSFIDHATWSQARS